MADEKKSPKSKKAINLVDEHIRRKMLNFDRHGKSGHKVKNHKNNLQKQKRKEIK